jgi:hypothetical protein
MADYPFWAAVRTVRDGISGRSGLSAFREAGGEIRDATWYRMISEARAAIAGREAAAGAPLDRRPVADEMTAWSTRQAQGFIQQVEVAVRDRDTGMVMMLPYSVKGAGLVTNQEAIDEALAHYTPEGTDGERQVILGAINVGTYRMTPEVEE